MSLSRVTSRVSRTVLTQCRNSVPLFGLRESILSPALTNSFGSLCRPNDTVSLLPRSSSLKLSGFQWFGFSSSASPHTDEKETPQTGIEEEIKERAESDASHETEAQSSDEKPESDSDSECDLSRDDLVKLVAEKEKDLERQHQQLTRMKDELLRSFAELENVKERTRRESENSKKFAIQNFSKSLLDVADNLGRASSAAKESFAKVDTSKDASGAVQQLKTLLEGVEMTEKQLSEVFRKFGLEKYDSLDEEFDPNRHNAVFQVPDPSKPAGRVAVVLKTGYILHDRVIRPAEVGVTVAANDEEAKAE